MGDVGGVVLPSGTVTLLFSDIEASTKMVHALGASWAQVLEQQRRLCRRAWGRHGGVEMGTEGDSFFVVFASPRDAVAAGLRVQASIAAASWPEGAHVRVRMGIHTGTPTRHADGYVGMDVHRGARVAAAAHGGQLLVSEPTMRLVAEALPREGVAALDLGEHQLKDIPTRTRLFQLDLVGHEERFPPLRTLGGAGSLPTALRDGLREVVGRDEDVAEVAALLAGGTRLVTLTGPGGVGKTTLATAVSGAVADRFPDGVFVAPMAGVTSAAGMWASMSQVLDVPPDGQVPPGFFTHVRDRRILLVLDNLEQIPDADAVVHELLDQAGHVSVIATSRRTLHVAGEHEHAVAGLGSGDAVALFAKHAARARRGFVVDGQNRAAVEELCAALDRLPLALEIAAARVKVLSPQAMLARIDSSLDLALRQRGTDDRQATLRVTIAWSYDLLDATRRTVLNHLGVFVGGASLDAAEAVVGPEALDGEDLLDVLFDLVDQSMVVVSDTADGEPRFHLLETVRRFALARLEESGRRPAAEQRHGQHFLDLVRGLMRSPGTSGYRAGRVGFLAELPNVDALLTRPGTTLEWDGTAMPVAHRYALAAMVALDFRLVEDARQWAGSGFEACSSSGADGDDDDLFARSWLASVVARTELQHGSAERASAIAAEAYRRLSVLGDAAVAAAPWPWRSTTAVVAELLYLAARGALDAGDPGTARRWSGLLTEVATREDDTAARLLASRAGFWIAGAEDDYATARAMLLEEEDHRRSRGLEVDYGVQNNLADADLNLGREDLAHARLAEHADALAGLGDPFILAICTETLAAVVGHEHPAECVRTYASASVFRLVEGIGNDEYGVAEDERVLAGVRPLLTAGEYDKAWERGRDETLVDRLRAMAALPTVRPAAR